MATKVTWLFCVALSSWAQIAYLQSQDKKAAAQRDFITLNKVAVKNGLTTAQEQFQFRAIHDFRLQSKHSGKRRTRSVPPNITFGTCTRLVSVQCKCALANSC